MSVTMGSDGDRCPDHTLEKDQELEEMVSLTRNGLPHTQDPENEDSPMVMVTSSSQVPRHGILPNWPCCRLCFLPIVTFCFIVSSLITSYIIAASLGHVHWDFPYISHTAIDTPERYIFGQLINIGALMLAANVYVRYLQMEACLRHFLAPRAHHFINRGAEVIGFLSALGLSVVANFQTKDMQTVHYFGAFIAFILGTVYCCLQTILSIKNTKMTAVTYFQIVVSALLTISLLIFIVSKAVYKVKETRGHGTKHDTLRDVYLVSTSSEWLTAVFMISFVLSFYRDFSNISISRPVAEIRNKEMAAQLYISRPQRRTTSTSIV